MEQNDEKTMRDCLRENDMDYKDVKKLWMLLHFVDGMQQKRIDDLERKFKVLQERVIATEMALKSYESKKES